MTASHVIKAYNRPPFSRVIRHERAYNFIFITLEVQENKRAEKTLYNASQLIRRHRHAVKQFPANRFIRIIKVTFNKLT